MSDRDRDLLPPLQSLGEAEIGSPEDLAAMEAICRELAKLLEPAGLAGFSPLDGPSLEAGGRDLGRYRIALDLRDYADAVQGLMPPGGVEANGRAEVMAEFCLNIIAQLVEAQRLQDGRSSDVGAALVPCIQTLADRVDLLISMSADDMLAAEYRDSLRHFQRHIRVQSTL